MHSGIGGNQSLGAFCSLSRFGTTPPRELTVQRSKTSLEETSEFTRRLYGYLRNTLHNSALCSK